MKKYTMRVLAGVAFYALAFAARAAAPVAPALPGHYYLGGITEVGSELLLKKMARLNGCSVTGMSSSRPAAPGALLAMK